jgi:hypothetical protein
MALCFLKGIFSEILYFQAVVPCLAGAANHLLS